MLSLATRSLALSLVLAPGTFLAGAPTQNFTDQPPASVTQQQQRPALNLDKRPKISDGTRIQLIQIINAEFVRVRKTFPLGYKDITLMPDGRVKPEDSRLYQLAMTTGAAAKVGDRVQITNIVFHEKSVYLEINGGPKKKTKWYQHVTVGGMGGSMTPGANDPNQAQPTGAAFSLEFKDHVPEMTGPELKQLLDPVFDFSVKTATEVYLETLPPKVKEAIKKHEVLVGMNRDMVIMAKERPPQKSREKDEKGQDYEEWIYGAPPQDVTFVRFVGDQVAQVKVLKIGGETILKTEKEVDVREGVVSLASVAGQGSDPTARAAQAEQQQANSGEEPTKRPTLKRAEDQDDAALHGNDTNRSPSPVIGPNDHKPVPQWGGDGQEKPPAPPTQPPN
jgi:hypothetical protein